MSDNKHRIKHNQKNDQANLIDNKPAHTVDNPWHVLRQYTAARIGLGRAGISVPTKHLLAFQLAHAQAQDAVHLPLDTEQLVTDIEAHCLNVHSQVNDRSQYLQRPDLGRRLNDDSIELLKESTASSNDPYDLAIVIVDGLSSFAIQQNAAPLLEILSQRLAQQALIKDEERTFRLAPIVIVQQGRVAIGDEVGEILNAKSVLVFIGERPGLSSPDSLGLYLTWSPKVGLTDESRNCISNVRPQGLIYKEAVSKVFYLLSEAHQRKLTGVNLKERSSESDDSLLQNSKAPDNKNFLLS
ncbi:MAG: ethanolamine ammonia-lyase small subunit [Oleispira sp.]|jgi:ethanolamine ammonia-lyase small subunit